MGVLPPVSAHARHKWREMFLLLESVNISHKKRTDGHTLDGPTEGRTDGRTNGWTDGRMDGQTDEWMDGRTNGWTDGQMDGRTDREMDELKGCFPWEGKYKLI